MLGGKRPADDRSISPVPCLKKHATGAVPTAGASVTNQGAYGTCVLHAIANAADELLQAKFNQAINVQRPSASTRLVSKTTRLPAGKQEMCTEGAM